MSLIFNTEAGYFVSAEHERIAQIIKDFSHTLELRFIPPKDRVEQEEKEWPFVLVDNPPGREPYLVMLLREDEINETLIARLFEMRVDPKDPMAKMRARMDAKRVVEMKKHQEEMDALKDFHVSLLKSPLHTYKHGGKVYS